MSDKIPRLEWVQLLALSGVHFLVDMFANMLPSILPSVREQFALSLSIGGLILVSLTLTSNFVQMLTGHLRARKAMPMFLHVGLILAAVICALSALPRSGVGVPLLILVGTVSGCGIAITHPEGLRAIHSLRRIPPAISTAVFMTGGFLGFASGGVISTNLVSTFGLKGLYPLMICPVVGVLMISASKVRLSTDHEPSAGDGPSGTAGVRLRFWQVMTMSVPAAISTTVLLSLLPTGLNELGFELTFGGFSTTMFGLGGTLGPFIWATIAQKKGELPCSVLAVFLAVPFLVTYLLLISSPIAVWILSGLGFCSMSAYILVITIARHATGLSLGQRMGFIVGGTWGLANLTLLALLPVADRWGTEFILKFTPLGYLFSGAFGAYIMLKNRAAQRSYGSTPKWDR
jgi:FSR family fosmidomycin resistance protein-like MFS transporter